MLEILKKSLEDFTAGNWDGVKASLADDVAYEELATGVTVKGADQLIGVMQRWRRAFPDVKCTFRGGFTSGDQVAAEIEWQGTQSGPMEGPFGTIQATNKRVSVRAAIVATLKDGKIVDQHHYFDMLKLLAQLGIAPGLPVPQPAKAPGVAAPKA